MEYESTLGLGLRPCRVKEKEKKNSRDVFVAKKSVTTSTHIMTKKNMAERSVFEPRPGPVKHPSYQRLTNKMFLIQGTNKLRFLWPPLYPLTKWLAASDMAMLEI
jgi:hypothetical protein